MPNPRQIALEKNESSLFADGEQGYDAEAGCPTADAGKRPAPDYAALIDAALAGRVEEMTRLVLEFDPEFATRGYHEPA